ncbi:transcriptional initiation protein Tat [Limnohabitans sp. Rim8]|uniref:PhoX family protein n=1 Tax=Limnohabitans sp. Rim8 TaxID=1100718 RepID=UPI000D3824C8|nr:PhoX family phosphatase [Limnohabitans sp. Rim8]PUE61304.1 transcriptional initiation protein Tat [Limnohabitans sp. Rim8]
MNTFDENDQRNHPRPEDTDFSHMVNTLLSRRQLLGAAGAGVGLFLGGQGLAHAAPASANAGPRIGFTPIAANSLDTITVPAGYQWRVLASWGDAILPGGTAFDPATRGTAISQGLSIGDNNDGMSFFSLGADHGVIAVNNEYANYEYLFVNGRCNSIEDTRKAQAAHGVSVFEVRRMGGVWKLQPQARLNRRITANTDMRLSGPAAGSALLKTQADPTGTVALGTFNNCANGRTPWGTYLTCEENFNGYFGTAESLPQNVAENAAFKRYGISAKGAGLNWHPFDGRFDLAKNPNEPNRFGWVVEIDPMDPTSTPIKRTALGRIKHENAEVVVNADGHVVVYMGDDEKGEHIYKFVSAKKFDAKNPKANRDLLDEGTLYVARFTTVDGKAQGDGEWLELTHGKNGLTAEAGFKDQAEVLVHTRLAATVVGATTMDRPEWIAVHPTQAQVYVTLTNNSDRGVKPNQTVNGPNPRAKNVYGQIVRWTPKGNDHTANQFTWDIFALAGNPTLHKDAYAGSANITPDNMFNSPDGLAFDRDGRLWIQTDGDYSNAKDFAGMGNNQMLCANPVTGDIKRFLVGPVACEITGMAFTPDQKTMFVGIQHPGEKLAASHFPQGGDAVPRSSIIAISRRDGGVVGV